MDIIDATELYTKREYDSKEYFMSIFKGWWVTLWLFRLEVSSLSHERVRMSDLFRWSYSGSLQKDFFYFNPVYMCMQRVVCMHVGFCDGSCASPGSGGKVV